MVRHLGQEEAADALEAAVVQTLEAGDTLTPDLGGGASTEQVGEAVLQALNGLNNGVPRMWWVYENLPRRRGRIHVASCSFCNDGQGLHDSTAPTGRWYGPFTTADAAIEQALETRADDLGGMRGLPAGGGEAQDKIGALLHHFRLDLAGCGVCQRGVGRLRTK